MKGTDFLFFAALLTLLSSCMQGYQVYVIESDDAGFENRQIYSCENEDLTIDYDFWSDGGTMLFNIYNRQDDTMFIHMKNSRLVANQEAFFYYLDDLNPSLELPDSNNSLSYSPYLRFDPIVSIPPGENRWFEGFPVAIDWYKIRQSNQSHSQSFTKNDSPVVFQNVLSYSSHRYWGTKEIKNEFWISMVKQASNSRFKIMAESDLNKGNKFYVSRKLARGDQRNEFWLDLGLSVLETLPYLF